MKLNKTEFRLMNNPVRNFIQKNVEFRRIKKLVTIPEHAAVLEIGCGTGHASNLIRKHFKPGKIHAIDLDPKMIKIAESRYADRDVFFEVGDAADLKFPDNHFDAVFDFGIIHHIPNWKDCLQEVFRVLKPGGQFIAEDLSKDSFQTWSGRHFKKHSEHPYEEMYYENEFLEYIEQLDFVVKFKKSFHPLHFIKYFLVIAEK